MKKALAMFLVLTCAVSMTACGGGAAATAESTAEEVVEEAVEEEAVEEEAVEEETAESEAEEAAAEEPAAEESGAVLTYEEYAAAELETEVTVEAYVQAKQSWWENAATVYAQDENGGYFFYNMACSEEDYALLTEGTKIRVTGYKTEWSGEVEIADATFEIIDGSYVAEPLDVTDKLGTDELINYQNQKVSFKGMTVETIGEDGGAYLYNWDGSGQEGDDLYFNVSLNGETYQFTVESYLCGADTDVYKAVKELQVGDVIDLEGFLYWYEGANPHITSVTKAA